MSWHWYAAVNCFSFLQKKHHTVPYDLRPDIMWENYPWEVWLVRLQLLYCTIHSLPTLSLFLFLLSSSLSLLTLILPVFPFFVPTHPLSISPSLFLPSSSWIHMYYPPLQGRWVSCSRQLPWPCVSRHWNSRGTWTDSDGLGSSTRPWNYPEEWCAARPIPAQFRWMKNDLSLWNCKAHPQGRK